MRLTGLLPKRFAVRQIASSDVSPTVTLVASASVPQLAPSPEAKRIDVIASGMFGVVGCPPAKLVDPPGGFPSTISYRPIGVRASDVVDGTAGSWYGIEILTDAPQAEVWYINRGGTSYRVSGDDQHPVGAEDEHLLHRQFL